MDNSSWEGHGFGRSHRRQGNYGHSQPRSSRYSRKSDKRRGMLGLMSRDAKVDLLYEFIQTSDDPDAIECKQVTKKDIYDAFIGNMKDKKMQKLWMQCASKFQHDPHLVSSKPVANDAAYVDELIDGAAEVKPPSKDTTSLPRFVLGSRLHKEETMQHQKAKLEISDANLTASPGGYNQGQNPSRSKVLYYPGQDKGHGLQPGSYKPESEIVSSLGVFPTDVAAGVDLSMQHFETTPHDIPTQASVSNTAVPIYKTKWLNTSDYIGHFYMNKVNIQSTENVQRTWDPAVPPGGKTKLLDFSDLVPVDGLQMAALCSSEPIATVYDEGFLSHFPPGVELSVIAPFGRDVHTEDVRVKLNFYSCNSCFPCQYGWVDEALCPDCRHVNHYPFKKLNCNFIMLLYSDHLRIIVPSASFLRTHWEKVVHFGWYGDFPVLQAPMFSPLRSPGDYPLASISWADVTEEEEAKANRANIFELDLRLFLSDLHFPFEDFLRNIDFSRISPCVRLIHCSPVPSNEGVNLYGKEKLSHLANHVPWQNNVLISDFYCTHRLGKSDPLSNSVRSLFPHIPGCATQPPKVVYPSDACVRSAISHTPFLSHDDFTRQFVFENFDKNFDLDRLMWKTDVPVLVKANIVCRIQEDDAEITGPSSDATKQEEVKKTTRKRGFLMVGSQSVGIGSWGRGQGEGRSFRMDRTELGVGLFPFAEERNGEHVVITPDLASVTLPFNLSDLTHYKREDLPFTPFTPSCRESDRLYVCLGELARWPKQFGFLESVPLPPVKRDVILENFPIDRKRHTTCDAFLHFDVCVQSGLQQIPPPVKSLLYFTGSVTNLGFRVKKILKLFLSKQEVLDFFEHDISSSVSTADDVNTGHVGNSSRLKLSEFDKKMLDLGLRTDEDKERHLLEAYKGQLPHLKRTFIPESRDQLEEELAMKPIQMRSDMAWLEQHVRKTCHGRMPPLTGPFFLPYLKKLMDVRFSDRLCGNLNSRA